MQRLILGTLILPHAAHVMYYPHLASFSEKGSSKVEAFLCSSQKIRLHKTLITKPCRNWQKKWKTLACIHDSLYVFFFLTPFANPNSLWPVVLFSQVEGLQGKGELLEVVQCHMKLWKYILRYNFLNKHDSQSFSDHQGGYHRIIGS